MLLGVTLEDSVGNRIIHPVPLLPPIPTSSPQVVRVLDRIRFQLECESDDLAEFCWFAREYPRCYRYHLDCAEHRLRSIHEILRQVHAELAPTVKKDVRLFAVSAGDMRVQRVYWDFESFLSEVNIALDLLARVAGTAYPQQMPPNFNKFCKKEGDSGVLGVMKRARLRWVSRLKDYRDCFTHYTPVDTMLWIGLVQCSDGFHFRAKLPVNPNVREILGFRYARRVELFRYACTIWRHMMALDRAVALEIGRSFRSGDYPKRTSNLFFVGRRDRD